MSRRACAALALLLVLACLAAYAPTRRARFLQDDHAIVQQNPIVRRGSLVEIFSTDYWEGVGGSETSLYRPVTIWSFALERGADGKVDPARAHILNVLLHALVSLALAALALRIGAGWSASFFAAALFALHPVHVSAVAGLVGRAEILSALFTLLALVAWSAAGAWSVPGAPSIRGGPARERIAAWSAGVSLFLALGSKEVALAAPVLLVLLEVSFRPLPPNGRWRWAVERCAALAPAALAVALHFALRLHALGVFPAVQRARLSENLLVGLEGAQRLATALGLCARYLLLLVYPRRLSADYSGDVIPPEPSLFSPVALAGALALLLLLCVALLPAILSLKGSPRARNALAPSFAALLYLLPYLAIGNLFVLVGIGFAERLVYLPSAGFCLLLALALLRLVPRARPLLVAFLLLAAGLRTYRAALDWQTDRTLFEAAVRATPKSPRAQFTLGKIRLDEGRTEEALGLFTRTTELWPEYSAAWYERGRLELARGDRAGARESLREAVRRNPGHADAAAALADLLFADARYLEAARFYARAARAGRGDVLPRLRESLARAGVSADRLP